MKLSIRKFNLGDQQSLSDNYQLKNVLTMNIHLRKYMLSQYKVLKKRIEKSINEIEIKLKK